MNLRFVPLMFLSLLVLLLPTSALGATGDAADVAAGLSIVNQIRAAANLPSVTVNTEAGTDATATARYSVLNNACLHSTVENPSNQYATAASTYDWGGQDQFCSINGPMSFQEFSNAFMTLPYHSVPFVSPLVTQVGFGYYQAQASDNIPSGGLTGATDFNFVYSGGSSTYPVLFPANGQTYPSSVTPIYGGGEDPDPLANCAGYSAPTGAPLVAQFATTPNVSQVTLSQGSSTVPSCWFTRSTDVNKALELNTVIVLPKAPLGNGTYSVCVQFSDGTPSVAWTFGVGGAPSSTTASCAGQATGPAANFSGTWSTDWYGNLIITQNGNQVTGTMPELSSGGLTGTVTGNVLQGTWQNDLSNPGLGIGLSVTISADGTTFAGNTDNNSYLTPIHGTRTTPVPSQSSPSGSPTPSVTPTPSSTPSIGTPVYNTPTPGCSTPAPGQQYGVCTQSTPVAEPQTAATIVIQSGNNQQLALNSAVFGEAFAPLSVGGLAPGVAVTFTCSAPSGVLCDLANGGATTVPANANGVATLSSNGIGIYSQGGTGTLTVRATAPGYASATFSETVLAEPGSPQAALTPSIGSPVYAPLNVAYKQLPGVVASDIGVGPDGAVWVTGTNQGIYQLSGTSWTQTDGAAVRIAIGPDGTPWVVNSGGGVYHRVNNAWQLLSATVTGTASPLVAADIGVGADGTVWVTGTNQSIYQLSGTNWAQASGGATEVTVQNSGVFYVANAAGAVYMGTVTP